MSEKCNCQCCVIWRKYEKRWKDKIAKLETELESLMNAPMTVQHYNKIQAEGIKRMMRKRDFEESVGWMEEYADKLEGKDEK